MLLFGGRIVNVYTSPSATSKEVAGCVILCDSASVMVIISVTNIFGVDLHEVLLRVRNGVRNGEKA